MRAKGVRNYRRSYYILLRDYQKAGNHALAHRKTQMKNQHVMPRIHLSRGVELPDTERGW